MGLSKPVNKVLIAYFEQLFNNPIRTKAITSCVIATAGNLTSQYISGAKVINQQSLFAYALYGLLFGGTLPHFFYSWLERTIPEEASYVVLRKLFLERIIFTPFCQVLALYVIARFEGKTHATAVKQVEALLWPVLSSNWKYLTVIQLLNLGVIPPMLRVLVMNIVGFFWILYIANKRRRQQAKVQ